MSHFTKGFATFLAMWHIVALAGTDLCTPATYSKMKPPRYPPEAVKDRATGKTILRLTIGADGVPRDISVDTSSGNVYLDQAAMESASDWRFEPERCGGKARATLALLPVDFSLTNLEAGVTSVDTAADDEPMEYQSIKDEEAYLKKRSDLEQSTRPLVHLFMQKNELRFWSLFESPDGRLKAVMRVRGVLQVNKLHQFYSYLCEGPRDWCVGLKTNQIETLRNNPMPPPPPPLQRAQ
ncbi:MAG: energy transducer TonB [Gammaproteobacteria bacterium]|nr:MAG: energy transducer TonB [Gammaproteobacteria bacterium]